MSDVVWASTDKPGHLTVTAEIGETIKHAEIEWPLDEARQWDALSHALLILMAGASFESERILKQRKLDALMAEQGGARG